MTNYVPHPKARKGSIEGFVRVLGRWASYDKSLRRRPSLLYLAMIDYQQAAMFNKRSKKKLQKLYKDVIDKAWNLAFVNPATGLFGITYDLRGQEMQILSRILGSAVLYEPVRILDEKV